MDHPSEDILRSFASGTASREESRAVVAHLVKGCPACARKIRELMEPKAVPRSAYEDPLDRFDQGLIDALESSISPMQTLRTVLRDVLPDPLEPEDDAPRKKR
jgi:anti-sigma factor RsiW